MARKGSETALDRAVKEALETRNEVSVSELKRKGVDVKSQAYRYSYRNGNRIPGVTYEAGKFRRIESQVEQNIIEVRWNREAARKDSIGRAAEALVLGNQEMDIRAMDCDAKLRMRLKAYWARQHRVVIIDSGTTTERITQRLGNSSRRNYGDVSLRVATNGLRIATTLNSSKRPSHGTIVIGGTLRRETMSIVGTLAERSIEALGLSGDMSIVGTTSLSNSGEFACNHEDEAETKRLLLQAGNIRCIAVDSSKILSHEVRSAWSFASVENIDVVITDPQILKRPETAEFERWNRFHEWVKEHGIALWVSDTPPKRKAATERGDK